MYPDISECLNHHTSGGGCPVSFLISRHRISQFAGVTTYLSVIIGNQEKVTGAYFG